MTSVLFGVVPLLLIAVLLSQGLQIVLGQYASPVVRDALDSELAITDAAAHVFARSARAQAGSGQGTALSQVEEIRQQTPSVQLVAASGGRTVTLPDSGGLRQIPEWMDPAFKDLLESSGRFSSRHLLAIFSDGVTEAENAAGEQFEASRLSDLLQQHARLPLDDLIKLVTDQLTRWIHQPETRDGITLVLARKRPAAG